jgi:hypothetical protein
MPAPRPFRVQRHARYAHFAPQTNTSITVTLVARGIFIRRAELFSSLILTNLLFASRAWKQQRICLLFTALLPFLTDLELGLGGLSGCGFELA